MRFTHRIAGGVTAGLLALGATTAGAAPGSGTGPMGFTPIAGSSGYADGTTATWNPTAPWNIPAGFSQELVSGELSDRCGGDDSTSTAAASTTGRT